MFHEDSEGNTLYRYFPMFHIRDQLIHGNSLTWIDRKNPIPFLEDSSIVRTRINNS